MQLNQQNLVRIAQQSKIRDYPRYVRGPSVGNNRICHIGVGGFHRAHQARYLHQLLNTGQPAQWDLLGIAFMPEDRALLDAMGMQDNLYSLWERQGDISTPHIIGSIVQFIDAIDARAPAISALSHPDTRIISLTITEKGYCLRADGTIDTAHPAIVADLNNPERPASAIGLIVRALQSRFTNNDSGVSIMSCDNLQANGEKARSAVLGLAQRIDPALAAWIQREVSFPLSMVDRITPRPDPVRTKQLTESYGFTDHCAVICEPWAQWILEDCFSGGRPDLEKVGVVFSDQVHDFEAMKVGLLNGGHSALSHIGILLMYENVDEAASDPDVREWLAAYMAEVQETLNPITNICFDDYIASLLDRFSNSAIEDSLFRLAEDSASKLQQCLLPPLHNRLARALPSPALAAEIAIWIRFLGHSSTNTILDSAYRDTNKTMLYKFAGVALRTGEARCFIETVLELKDATLCQFSREVDTILSAMGDDIATLRSWLKHFNARRASDPSAP